jgi:hypothetical protein
MNMPPAMGMGTAINLQMSGDKVSATGDSFCLQLKLTVIKALTANGIIVTAVHNHMLFD